MQFLEHILVVIYSVSSMRRSVSPPDDFNTEKRVENTMNFEVFHLLMKHCVICLMLDSVKQNDFKGEIKDAKMSRFSSEFQKLIKH